MNAILSEPIEFDPFAGAAVERVVQTSEAQREIWLADQLGPQASLAFNESISLRLRGRLDLPALRGALDALIGRHESLRATVGPDGTQLLIGEAAGVELPVVDLRAMDARQRQQRLDQAAARSVETRFDLANGPLFRAELHRLADDDQLLTMVAHHIVCDGWSWGVIIADLAALYAEQLGIAPGPDAPAQYSDYVAWEAREAAGADTAGHEAFWLGRFAGGSLPVLDLPTDRPRAPVRGFDSHRIDHVLDAGLVAELRRLGAAAGTSLFAALFSGFAATLRRLTGQDDLVIGVPAAGQSASGMTALVGHCVNLLPIRTAVDAQQPFEALVRQSGSALLDAFEHQAMTYGTLLKKLAVPRDPSRLPLVGVMFNLDPTVAGGAGAFAGLDMELVTNPRRFENFELFLNAVQAGGGLRLECQYNTDLFDAATIERWLGAYEALLRAAVRGPAQAVGALDWLAPSERARLQSLQPAPTPAPVPSLMHAAVVRQAAQTPQRVALRLGDARMDYRELDERSNRLARALRARGIRRGERVGLCLNRGMDMVVALLGVLKAGGTYVPLDPGFPQARLAYYAEDARLALLLTESTVATAPAAWRDDADQRILHLDRDAGWLRQPADALPAGEQDATPDDAAYVIYTSGSTGKPKGVCVPHCAVANFLASMQREPGIGADDRLAAVTTLSFDIAVLELLLPLAVGAQVILVPRETSVDAHDLRALLESSGATIMQATPGMWRLLLDSDWRGAPGFKALVGGESLPPDLAHALLDRAGEVWNMYGPTETTVWSTVWRLDRAQMAERGIPIGRPIDNTTVWILDEACRPCPVGVPGEICIGGDGVALGYLDRPELTADRFIADPFSGAPGARLYRTGDRGRWRNDGLLEHLGRLDFQVKVRGYRIELGEIEAACNECAGVAQSVVVARQFGPGDVRLVAYLNMAPGSRFDREALRGHLRGRLPEYMIPQHFMVLDAIPLLPNGKVDRKALPEPGSAKPQPHGGQRVPPRTEVQRKVVAAMESVLNLPRIGIHDDFFSLGGHSLLAARLASRLGREFGIALSLTAVFESPTAEQLAAAIEAARASGQTRRAPIEHRADQRSAPLAPVQERIRYLEELHPGRLLHNVPSGHRLKGRLDLQRFEAALRAVVAHQPALRTFIAPDPEGDGYLQQVADSVEFDLPFEDLSALPQPERETVLMRRMQDIVDTPIDIHQAPLFRAAMYKLADDEHAFLFMPHHIVWDGWSFDLLYDELAAAYTALIDGRACALPALPVTYGDYAQWHADWMRSAEFEALLGRLKQRLARIPVPDAPASQRRRRVGMMGQGGVEWIRLDASLVERLRQVARDAGTTLNMLTLAVYGVLVATAQGSDSVVISVPLRGRSTAETEPIMGAFANPVPVPLRLPGERSVRDFIDDVRQELVESFAYQEIPFERLILEPELASRFQTTGLYQGLFSFQDARNRIRRWGGLDHQMIQIFQKDVTQELGLWLVDLPESVGGAFFYNRDAYSEQTVIALRERYIELLGRLADDPTSTLGALAAPTGSAAGEHLRRLAAGLVEGADGMQATAARVQAPADATQASAGESRLPAGQARALTHEEQALAQVWASLLELPVSQIRPGDNFFDLGGDSLLAMRAIEQARQALGFRVQARRYIFESLAQLASPQAAASREAAPVEPAEAQPRNRLARLIAGFGRKKGAQAR